MDRLPRIVAAAGPLADLAVGTRVQTKEGYPGVITDVHEGAGDLTTYWVTLDNSMGEGEYAEAEIWAIGEARSAAVLLANVEHTAADDYPELGSILTDRLPPQITSTAGARSDSEGLDEPYRRPAHETSEKCPVCGKNVFSGQAYNHESSPEHQDALRAQAPFYKRPLMPGGLIVGSLEEHQAITLTPPPPAGRQTAQDPDERRGYEDGMKDGKAGVTRNIQDPSNSLYRAGYDRGWAFGVDTLGPAVESWEFNDMLEDQQVVDTEPHLAGFFTDFVKGNPPDERYKGHLSYDWCRYRRDQRCKYSKNLDLAASEQAGYAVWVPEDRGMCFRSKWEAQQACEVAMPGPNVPGGFTDATVSWADGGQRGGGPTNTYRQSSLEAVGSIDPVFAFHMTSSWKSIQDKAKRMRAEGGVRLIASQDGVVVGQIRGDTNVYESELVSVPGRRSVASWACGCKWGSYSWGRSGPWKKYEGRMCSHALALSYEVQSRGMFGKDLPLDEKQPTWMDSSIPVRTPNSYDRDKNRYASMASGRPVEEQYPEDTPLISVAALMLSEGYRYAEIKMVSQACGVEDVPSLVREARKTKSFPAKVRGLVRSLFIEDRKIYEEDSGKEVAQRDVLFPNWTPTKGLNYRPPRESSTGCGGGCGDCSCGSQHTATQHTATPADIVGRASTMEEAAEALLAIARQEERTVTPQLTSLATREGGEMRGLDFRFKSKGSLLRKMNAEARQHKSPGLCAMSMSDSLRYTMVFSPETYTESTKDVLSVLKSRGYGTRTKNYWGRGDAYNGVNVALTTPEGFPVELQFHTDQSLSIKETQVHPIYETWRKETNEFKRAQMGAQMRDLYDMAHRPPGALGITDRKMQPHTPWNKVDWMRGKVLSVVGQPGPYRYLLTDTEHVLRFDLDDSTSEIFEDGQWVEDPEYARYTFLGEPRADEIDEEEAIRYINRVSGWGFEPSYNGIQGEMTVVPAHSYHEMATIDEAHLAPLRATLDEEPEAALPMTYGDDEVDPNEAAQRLSAYFTVDDLRQKWESSPQAQAGMSAEDALAQVYAEQEAQQATYADPVTVPTRPYEVEPPGGAEIVAQVDAFIRGESSINPLAHLGDPRGSSTDNDVMAAAQEFKKQALKTYTPAERQQFIDEGQDSGVVASNLDRLDISGTHYEALEMTQAKMDSIADVEDSWMMDGDPND